MNVFDILRIDLKLDYFRFFGPLWDHDGMVRRRAPDSTNEEDPQKLCSDIEAYVLHGGVSPLQAL